MEVTLTFKTSANGCHSSVKHHNGQKKKEDLKTRFQNTTNCEISSFLRPHITHIVLKINHCSRSIIKRENTTPTMDFPTPHHTLSYLNLE
jgi:hypothetical protein